MRLSDHICNQISWRQKTQLQRRLSCWDWGNPTYIFKLRRFVPHNLRFWWGCPRVLSRCLLEQNSLWSHQRVVACITSSGDGWENEKFLGGTQLQASPEVNCWGGPASQNTKRKILPQIKKLCSQFAKKFFKAQIDLESHKILSSLYWHDDVGFPLYFVLWTCLITLINL